MRDESHTCPQCPKSWKLFRWNFHQETIYWACYRSELNEHNSKIVPIRNPRPNPWIIRDQISSFTFRSKSCNLEWITVLTGVHSRTRGETIVEFLPSQQEGSHAKQVWIYSKFEFTLYCVYCMLCEWKKKHNTGEKDSFNTKTSWYYHQWIYHSVFQKTHQSIVCYSQKRVSWISVQSSQQPLCRQASKQAYMVKHAIVNTKASLIGLQGPHQAQQHTQCKERMQMQCNIATNQNNKTTHHNHNHHHHHHHHLVLHHLTRNLVLWLSLPCFMIFKKDGAPCNTLISVSAWPWYPWLA